MSPTPISSADAGRSASGVRSVGARRLGRRGLGRGAAIALAIGLALVIALIDQLTKRWALAHLTELVPRRALGDLLRLDLLHNSGAAGGIGAGSTPVVTVLQIVIAVVALVFVVRSVRSAAWAIALGLIVGGALGNIHDRLLRPPGPFRGEVVDFLQLPHWPVFNVADMGVTVGAVLVVLLGLLGVAPGPAPAREKDAVA